MTISKSPERHTFQAETYVKRCKENGEEPSEDYLDIFKSARQRDEENMVNPEWQKNNLEYDLRSTQWILDKARASDNYAQNLYAALCNMEWQNRDLWPELKEDRWSCSWRHAGGIVADMQEKGDYIDWYCSGIGNREAGYGLDNHVPDLDSDGRCYVPEGYVTEELERDLNKLGWRPIPYKDDE